MNTTQDDYPEIPEAADQVLQELEGWSENLTQPGAEELQKTVSEKASQNKTSMYLKLEAIQGQLQNMRKTKNARSFIERIEKLREETPYMAKVRALAKDTNFDLDEELLHRLDLMVGWSLVEREVSSLDAEDHIFDGSKLHQIKTMRFVDSEGRQVRRNRVEQDTKTIYVELCPEGSDECIVKEYAKDAKVYQEVRHYLYDDNSQGDRDLEYFAKAVNALNENDPETFWVYKMNIMNPDKILYLSISAENKESDNPLFAQA